VADVPTTEGVIAAVGNEPLQGKTVGVTLYGQPNLALEQFLMSAGANARTVLPYIYAPAADAKRVLDLIARMDRGEVDVIAFTSSPQIERLYEVAIEHKLEETLRQGLGRTRVAAVGPVVAETLRQRDVRLDICPEQGFVMKNLVQHIKRALERDQPEPGQNP
jgi:uroporphyrinogen-III synthase